MFYRCLLMVVLFAGTALGQSNTNCPVMIISQDGLYWIVQFNNCVTPGSPFIRRVTPKPVVCVCSGGNCVTATLTVATGALTATAEPEAQEDAAEVVEYTDGDYYGVVYDANGIAQLKLADGSTTKLSARPGRGWPHMQVIRRHVDMETLQEVADGSPVTIVRVKPRGGSAATAKPVLIVYEELDSDRQLDFGFTRVRYDVTLPDGEVVDVMTLELAYQD